MDFSESVRPLREAYNAHVRLVAQCFINDHYSDLRALAFHALRADVMDTLEDFHVFPDASDVDPDDPDSFPETPPTILAE